MTAPDRKGLSMKSSVGSLKKKAIVGGMNVDANMKPRAGSKPKALGEIVDTSVEGEVEWT